MERRGLQDVTESVGSKEMEVGGDTDNFVSERKAQFRGVWLK